MHDGFFQAAQGSQGVGQVVVGTEQRRLDSQGRMKMRDRLVHPPHSVQENAHVVVTFCVVRSYPQCFLVMGDRLLGSALAPQRLGQVDMRLGKIRFDIVNFKQRMKDQQASLQKLKEVGETLGKLTDDDDEMQGTIKQTIDAIAGIQSVVESLEKMKLPEV